MGSCAPFSPPDFSILKEFAKCAWPRRPRGFPRPQRRGPLTTQRVLCMGAHTSIIPEPSAGRACSQHSPREGSQCLPSLLAGSHRTSHTYVVYRKGFICTYLSFREAKPRKQEYSQFYTWGLKLCYRCSFRGVWERTCVLEPNNECLSDDGSITQHPSALKKNMQYFATVR